MLAPNQNRYFPGNVSRHFAAAADVALPGAARRAARPATTTPRSPGRACSLRRYVVWNDQTGGGCCERVVGAAQQSQLHLAQTAPGHRRAPVLRALQGCWPVHPVAGVGRHHERLQCLPQHRHQHDVRAHRPERHERRAAARGRRILRDDGVRGRLVRGPL